MYEQTLLRLVSRKLASAMLFLLLVSISVPAQADVKTNAPAQYTPVTEYDPKRDASVDIQDAIREAERTHKHILLEVGGEWCSWCHTLDRFFQTNPELLKLRDKNFVTLKINFSEENKNKEVLSPYPTINGYPHLFFLDSDLIARPGRVLLHHMGAEVEELLQRQQVLVRLLSPLAEADQNEVLLQMALFLGQRVKTSVLDRHGSLERKRLRSLHLVRREPAPVFTLGEDGRSDGLIVGDERKGHQRLNAERLQVGRIDVCG